MSTTSPAAFLSYCREDSAFAMKLAADLKAVGAGVWVDQLDIIPGQHWDDAVEHALTNCPRLLVVLSPASVNSTNVMDEVAYALEEHKIVIPIIYRDCTVPFRLRRVQHVDVRQDYARGLRELVNTLGAERVPDAGVNKLVEHPTEPAVKPLPLEAVGKETPRVSAAHAAAQARPQPKHKEEPSVPSLQQPQRPVPASIASFQIPDLDTGAQAQDEEWESEKKRREKALTDAILREWSAGKKVHGNDNDSEPIRRLRAALNEWQLECPQGFEARQAERRQRESNLAKLAMHSWRSGGKLK